MRSVIDIFGQTLRTLWAHKLRSFLTMFGIAWGVGSLLLLVGLGEGFRSGNRRQLDSIGRNIMFIFPGERPAIPGNANSNRRYFLTYRDYESIKAEAPHVGNVAPLLVRGDVRVVSEFASAAGQVTGTTPVFSEIRYLPLARGRWLNNDDIGQRRNIAILGDELVKTLFPGQPALGARVLLNGVPFEIVGTLERVGRGDNNSTNSRVIIPYPTMAVFYPLKGENVPQDALSFINYQPTSREDHMTARTEVHRLIGRNHDFDPTISEAFEEWDTIESERMVGKIFDAMNLFLGSVGLVTLALGAIGIVNIMLVAVTERTKEIGLRKSLGATNRSIMGQFFLEGVILTSLSGAIGIAGAAGLMSALSTLPQPDGFDTPRLVPASAALAMLSLSLAGIIAGLYPARKAAHLDPVEALRAE